MKKVVLASLLTAGLAVSTSAYDTKVVTTLLGGTGANIQTYHNVGLGSSQLILGATASFPFSSDMPLSNYSGIVGMTFDTDLPVLGNFELITDVANDSVGNLKMAQSLSVTKKYYAKLTDKLELGISANLFKYTFEPNNLGTLGVLTAVNPVVALTVKI